MNPDRLLKHYERIADSPDAVARLRGFILDLAVRGKLVPQDPSDEPASTLLKRIAKEKARASKREKIESDIDNLEELGELPSSWQAVPLIALGSWAIGSGFPKNEQGLEAGPHFFLKVSDMNLTGNEKYVTSSNNFIDDEAARRMRAKIHPPGTIIFPKIGGAIATNKRRILTKGSAIDNNCLGITFASEINVEWAYMLLTTLDFTRYQAGTAVPALQQGVLERIPVGLPPLAEQHRIVAKVDELMALCDRLEAARTEREASRDRLMAASLAHLGAPDPDPTTFATHARFALDNLAALSTRPDQIKQLRQTILNRAVRGKLVRQDPNDEPASELLKRIAKERTGPQATNKARRNGESEISSLWAETPLPMNWRWSNIDEIALSMRYGTSTKCEYAAAGVPVLRIPNVSGGVVSLDDIKCGPLTEGEIRDLALSAGDLLMIRSNGSLDIVGRSAVVTAEAEGMAFAGYLVRLRLSLSNIKPEYIWLALNSSDVRDQIERPIRSAVGLKNVNLTEFGALTFPLPPLAEQHRIVAKVDELMALCDGLESSLAAGDATRRRLLDALLAQALAPAERDLVAAE